MYEVEIIKVTFKAGGSSDTEVVNAEYFDWLSDAKDFADRFNSRMPIDDTGYVTAWKPTECVSLTNVLVDGLQTLRNQLNGLNILNLPSLNKTKVKENINSLALHAEKI